MMNTQRNNTDTQALSDVLGMSSALLCLVHCLAAPVLLGFGVNFHKVESSFFLHEYWDLIFLFLGFIAVWFSSKHSTQPIVKVTLWITYIFLFCSILFLHASAIFEYATYASSFLLIIIHSVNFRQLSTRKTRMELNCDC